jgi:hypothetical protein
MPQIRDPSLPKLEDLPESYKSKVCIARVACAVQIYNVA